MLTIEKIKVKDLYGFACRCKDSPAFRDIFPMTPSRAIAYMKNPYTEENDIALLAASIDGGCVAYLGILPGLLRHNNQSSKIYWFSTFFVSEKFRGQGIGLSLVKEAFSLNYDLAATPLDRTRSEKVFMAAGMAKLSSWDYCSLDLRFFNPLTIPLRALRTMLRAIAIEPKALGKGILWLDRLLLPLIKKVFYWFLAPKVDNQLLRSYSFREVRALSKEAFESAGAGQTGDGFYRGLEWLNWMLEYPWLKDKADAQSYDKSYFFSGLYDSFRYTALEFYGGDGKSRKGYAIYSVARENTHTRLKFLDLCFIGNKEYLSAFIWQSASLQKASCVEFSGKLIPYLVTSGVLKLITVSRRRSYLCHPKEAHSPLAEIAGRITFEYSDADNAFY